MTGTEPQDPFDVDALGAWLAAAVGAERVVVRLEGRPAGGFSAETLLLDADVTVDGSATHRRFVLRKETPEPAVYPQQSDVPMPEIEIQYRIMDALRRRTSVPVADMLGYTTDPTVCGAPFFAMSFVDGVVPIESPPYTVEGFFTDATPAQRTALVSSGLAQLAALHSVDRADLDLDWLVPAGVAPGSRHLVDLWRRFGERELAGRSHPLLEHAWAIVDATLPDDERLVLCWGDPRPGNIIWRDFAPACLTDFEAACIGPPEFDLAWWLMFDRTMHEGAGVDRRPGDPSRDEQRRIYYEHAGRPLADTTAHELFAAARYCVIVVRVMNRLDQRGLLPADSRVWLENPASECLASLLGEIA